MPRKFGSVNVEMWNDPEFRDLPPAAQHLYLVLWTAPDLSFCGVHDWRPGRLSRLSRGFNEDHVRLVADCLVARYFIVIDEDTEEVLVRSWARFDELLKQPRLAVSYSAAYAATYSPTLRQVLARETQKMRDLWPELACWKDDRVSKILDHPAVSAKELPTPEDPFGHGFGDGFGMGLPQTQGKVWASVSPSVSAPPTPAPTPTPNTRGAKKRATPLPDNFSPTDKHKTIAAENGINLDREVAKFAAHAEANDRRQVNWNAALSQWLLSDKTPRSTPVLPNGEGPDDWMRR